MKRRELTLAGALFFHANRVFGCTARTFLYWLFCVATTKPAADEVIE